jgi:hypothetical protein
MHPKQYHDSRWTCFKDIAEARRDLEASTFKDVQTDELYSMLSPDDLANIERELDRRILHLENLLKCVPTANIAASHALINGMRIFEAKLALSQAKSYPSRAAVTGRTYLSGPTVAELVKEGPFKAVFDDTAGKCQHCQA